MNRQMVENYLVQEPRFRERSAKNRGLARLLQKKYSSLKEIPIDILTDMVGDVHLFDRYWRMILSERPELRGSDYDDKIILEQSKKIELGYERQIKLNV